MNNWASNICQDEFRDGSRDCKRRSQRRRCFQKKMRKIKVNLGFRSENEGVREWNRWTNKELVRTRQNYRAQETKRRPTNAYCRSEGFLFEDRASQQGREGSGCQPALSSAFACADVPIHQLQGLASCLAVSKAGFYQPRDWVQSPGSQRYTNQRVTVDTHKCTFPHRRSPEESE